jgi:hypothetical protein
VGTYFSADAVLLPATNNFDAIARRFKRAKRY